MPKLINNQELQRGGIPSDTASDLELAEFALSFDGYREFDSKPDSPSCDEIANSRDHSSLSRVRACLFFEQRRSRQSDIGWDRSYVLELLSLIRKYVHEERYRLPGIQGKNGATVVDLVREIDLLCQANIETIRRMARFNTAREIRDEKNRRLRAAHNVLGMAPGTRRFGVLYYEKNIDTAEPFVVEHAIPVTQLVNLIEQGKSFLEVVFLPVATISRAADLRLAEEKLTKTGHDEELRYVFQRYAAIGIDLVTYDGEAVDPATWTIADHRRLIKRTPELSDVYKALLSA